MIFTIFCYFYREKLERQENVDEMENPGQEEPWDREDLQDQEETLGKEVTQDFQEMMANQEHQEHQYVFRGTIFTKLVRTVFKSDFGKPFPITWEIFKRLKFLNSPQEKHFGVKNRFWYFRISPTEKLSRFCQCLTSNFSQRKLFFSVI